MFNSMELMAQYTGGASIPLTKFLVRQMRKGVGKPAKPGDFSYKSLDPKDLAKDRQRISRNITGVAAIFAATQYRTSENAPSDYKLLNTGDGTVLDTSPLFPIRQLLFIEKVLNKLI